MASISEILDKIIAKYQPGGGFGESELALLKRGKTKAMAGVGQQLVSSGLAGTTAGAGASQRWEEEVGMPTRLGLEDIRTQRLVQALLAKAGFQEKQTERQFEYGQEQRARQERLNQQIRQENVTAAARPGPGEAGFMGGGWSLSDSGGGTQQSGVGVHTGGGADFTIPTGSTGGARGTGAPEIGVSDPTFGQEVYGPDAGSFGGVATRGGVVGAEPARTPITSGAPSGWKNLGPASFNPKYNIWESPRGTKSQWPVGQIPRTSGTWR